MCSETPLFGIFFIFTLGLIFKVLVNCTLQKIRFSKCVFIENFSADSPSTGSILFWSWVKKNPTGLYLKPNIREIKGQGGLDTVGKEQGKKIFERVQKTLIDEIGEEEAEIYNFQGNTVECGG